MARSAQEILYHLYAVGVDNWDGYGEALSTVDDLDDPEEVLTALHAAGVDNWEGYRG